MQTAYRFGDYALDVQGHALRRGETEIHLGERAFCVLTLLVENAGRVISRRELIDAVWRDVIVTDDSLARAVSDLRTALLDDASNSRFIRTVHRQGYVFVATVTTIDPAESVSDLVPRPRLRWVRNPLVLIAIGAIVVVSMLALREWMSSSDDETALAQPDLSTWRLRALGPLPFMASAIKPAFAKSDNLLAVVAPDAETGVHSIFLLRPDGGEPLQLTRDIEVRGPSPEFTADDSHIIFTTYASHPDLGLTPDVWLAPVPAGEPTLLLENASAASSSPDGRALVYSAVTPGGTSIRVRHEDGGEIEVAERGFWPRWSPRGDWIAYTTSDPEGGDGRVHVVRVDGSEHRELTTLASQVYGLCWNANGSHVIFASAQGGPMMLWSVEVASRTQMSVTRGPGDCASPTMAPDGRRLVFDFSHRRWYVYLATEPGDTASRVLVEPGLRAAALSPEGTRIALAGGAEAQSPAVSLLDIDTMERRTLSGMSASSVAWMPGGRNLLVAAPAPDETSQWIWRIPIGGGLPHPVMKGLAHWRDPRPSPDGNVIAAARRSEAGWDLVLHRLEDGAQRILARNTVVAAPRWSPDGRFLAWSGTIRPDDLGSGGVWICPVDAGTPRRLTMDGAWPVWENDGEHLLFARFLEHKGIWRVPRAGGSPQLVRRLDRDFEDLYMEGLDLGRNGAPLLFLLSKSVGEIYALEPPAD
jgi:DNA-binding winged helix-turn-helix (wHTH) protein/Tol biopolymer transport system component